MVLQSLLAFPVYALVLGFVEYESTTGGNQDVAVSPDGRFVYSVELYAVGNQRINVYSRNADSGLLELVEFVDTLDGATTLSSSNGLAISPDGNQLYAVGTVNNFSEHAIIWFSRDSASGKLTYAGRIVSNTDFTGLGNASGSMAISPDGFFLYAGDIGGFGSVLVFKRAANGVLTWVETVEKDLNGDNLSSINEVYVSPDGKALYATALSGHLYVYSRDVITGSLALLQVFNDFSLDVANGIPGLGSAEEPIVTSDGRFLYLAGKIVNHPTRTDDDQYNVVTFARDTRDGTLTYLSNTTNQAQYSTYPDWDTLWGPTALALSPDSEQKFLYVGAYIADSINLFRRDAQTGDLTWIGWEVDGLNNVTLDGIDKLQLSPDGRHIYAALKNGHGLTVFDTRADLALTKTDDIDPIAPLATLTYTLAVTNLGPADAQNVVITDTLPDGVAYVDGSVNMPGGACSESGGTVTCTAGSLAVTAETNAVIRVTVPANEGTITNTAGVSADQLDTEAGNDSDSEDTIVGQSSTPPPSTGTPGGGNGDGGSGGGGSWNPLALLVLGVLLPLLRRRAGVTG